MDKSPEAFRTISEVAEALETPAHVLRFWESRFPQIRPVKRAGGRRYYRPSDVALLTGIKRLLHDEGMTIRGVQKILREQGTRHVSGLTEEPSAEEIALEAAMAVDLDPELDLAPEPSVDEAADATAAALTAALDAEEVAKVVPLFAPQEAAADTPQDATEALVTDLVARATEEPPEAPPSPPEPPAQAEAAPPVAEAPTAVPPPRVESPGEDTPTATLAARLRALPRGSLAGKQEALAAISARMADLRARLAAPPSTG